MTARRRAALCRLRRGVIAPLAAVCAMALPTAADAGVVVVRAGVVHTMEGPPIRNGLIVVGEDGTIAAVGPASTLAVPAGATVYDCAVATPGLVDIRGTVGLTGIFNVDHDQDVLETSAPIQPELRAADAYNPLEPLVGFVRSLGVTTVHIGHAPGKLATGQTAIVKTRGKTLEQALVRADVAVTATLGPSAQESGPKSPGTRAKQLAMLREQLFKAQDYLKKTEAAAAPQAAPADDVVGEGVGDSTDAGASEGEKKAEPPARDLKLEALAAVLTGDRPLIITANRAQDIASALRLQEEFGIRVWIDSAAEAAVLAGELKAAGVPVLLHPTTARAWGELANASWSTAATLLDAGVPVAIQSGYEAYVPKVRVVLFEAAVAAGPGGLGFDRALAAITIEPARLLGIDSRVGSLAPGKDADIALYDGDPFEYTTRCLGTLIDGVRYDGEADYRVGYPGGGWPEQR